MSFFLRERRIALLLLIILFPMTSEQSEASLIPQRDIYESIPFEGTWKLSKVKDVKVDGVWIERTLPEGKNLLPVRFILNQSADTTFFITSSRENILFNFGENAPAYLKNGKLKFVVPHYSTGGDSAILILDAAYTGETMIGTMELRSETSEAYAEGIISMKIADPLESSQLNGVFSGDVTVASASGDQDMVQSLESDMKMLIKYTDQYIVQAGDLAAFTWVAKQSGMNILSKSMNGKNLNYLFSTGSTQQEDTYILLGYFINKSSSNSFTVKIDDELLKTIGVPEDPKHIKTQQFDFSRQASDLLANIHEWEQILDDQGNSKTAEVNSNYKGTLTEGPQQFLKVEVTPSEGTEFKCGQSATVEVKLFNQFNKINTEFNGSAILNLLDQVSTEGLTSLPASQSLSFAQGIAKSVSFSTPKEPFSLSRQVDNNTVLTGEASVKVQIPNSTIPAAVKKFKVKSPFDFYVDRVEINQSVYGTDKETTLEFSPGTQWTFLPLPFVTEHNTLVQVYVDIKNKNAVPYTKIELKGITGQLKILNSKALKPVKEFKLEKADPKSKEDFVYKDKYTNNDYASFRDAFSIVIKNEKTGDNDFVIKDPDYYAFAVSLNLPLKLEETEADKKNNSNYDSPFIASFDRTKPLKVLSCYGYKDGEPALPSDLWDFFNNSWTFLKDVYPIQSSGVVTGTGLSSYNVMTRSFTELSLVRTVHNLTNPSDWRDYIVLFTSPSLAKEFCNNNAEGCVRSLGITAVAVVGQPAVSSSVETLAHEMGHILGLLDTYTDPDPILKLEYYPIANPRRSDANDAGNRVENGNINFMNWTKVSPGDNYRDFMGSSGGSINGFVDRVTWDYLLNKRFSLPSVDESSLNASSLNNSYITVSGTIDSAGTGSFEPFITFPQMPYVSKSEAGEYFIEFQNSSGTVIYSHNFKVIFYVFGVGRTKEVFFSLDLPLPEGTKRVVLKKNNTELASRTLSQNTPEINITSPENGETIKGDKVITWTASDKDGDEITYDLLYSYDGINHKVIAVNLQGTSFTFHSDQQAASKGTGKITVIANDGFNQTSSVIENLTVDSPLGIDNGKKLIPESFSLKQNFPNPFNPATTIRFELPQESYITLKIYDLQGQLIKTLINEIYPAGTHDIDWNGESENGARVTSGMYFIEMRSGEYHHVNKAILVK